MVASIRDVSDRRSSRAQLQKMETRYRTLVEGIPAVTFMAALDEAANELYVSPQIEAVARLLAAGVARQPDPVVHAASSRRPGALARGVRPHRFHRRTVPLRLSLPWPATAGWFGSTVRPRWCATTMAGRCFFRASPSTSPASRRPRKSCEALNTDARAAGRRANRRGRGTSPRTGPLQRGARSSSATSSPTTCGNRCGR